MMYPATVWSSFNPFQTTSASSAAEAGRLRVVPQQEERFLDRHHEQAHGEEGAEKEQVAGQRRKGPAGGVR